MWYKCSVLLILGKFLFDGELDICVLFCLGGVFIIELFFIIILYIIFMYDFLCISIMFLFLFFFIFIVFFVESGIDDVLSEILVLFGLIFLLFFGWVVNELFNECKVVWILVKLLMFNLGWVFLVFDELVFLFGFVFCGIVEYVVVNKIFVNISVIIVVIW